MLSRPCQSAVASAPREPPTAVGPHAQEEPPATDTTPGWLLRGSHLVRSASATPLGLRTVGRAYAALPAAVSSLLSRR